VFKSCQIKIILTYITIVKAHRHIVCSFRSFRSNCVWTFVQLCISTSTFWSGVSD